MDDQNIKPLYRITPTAGSLKKKKPPPEKESVSGGNDVKKKKKQNKGIIDTYA